VSPARAGLAAVGVVLAAAAMAVAGCGMPLSDGAEPLPAELAELAPLPQQESAIAAPTQVTDLAWVKGDRLRLAPREVMATDTATQAAAALAAVIAGPNPDELARGLSTEVPPDLLATLILEGNSAIVDLQGSGDGPGTGNVTLGTAQLALAVLLVPGVDSVTFTVQGVPAEVPRGDGKVRPGPVTLVDYAALLGGRGTR
jgi:spore germination protein GerM